MAEIKPEWRNVTLGEVYDELESIKKAKDKHWAEYNALPKGEGHGESFDALMDREREACDRVEAINEQILPILESLVELKVFIVEMGSSSAIKLWVEMALSKMKEAHLTEDRLSAKLTSVEMNEDKKYWIFLNVETKSAGLN
jgi:hypothetical protein